MAERLQGLLEKIGVDLEEGTCKHLEWYLEEMLRWNRSINLTAIEKPEEALEKHLVDSLTIRPLLKGNEYLLDMGSGAGLPGIPLKIVCPALHVLSVDSVNKKIVFQQHVMRHLGLRNFEAKSCRIQALTGNSNYMGSFDIVTARALTHLSRLLHMADPFLKKTGRLIAMKGPDAESEIKETAEEMDKTGFVVESISKLRLPESGAERKLIVLQRHPSC